MIGLGSNRLSVCRRGGMVVTQAGRGGMEWLGSIRYPDWATPYSAQATAALKDAYGEYWPIIRNFGFEHPECVVQVENDIDLGYFIGTGKMLVGLPKMSTEATSVNQYTWQANRPLDSVPANWYAQNAEYYKGWPDVQSPITGFNRKHMISSMYFVPSAMPTGIKFIYDEYIYIYLNGELLHQRTSYSSATWTVPIDFTGKMNLNEINHICVRGSDVDGGAKVNFGFY